MWSNNPYLNAVDKARNYMTPESRLWIEKGKVKQQFPQFETLADGSGNIVFQGYLQTNAKGVYKVRITLPPGYPVRPPLVKIVNDSLYGAPHRYSDNHPCLFRPDRWNPGSHTIAFVIARTAKWLNKFEIWRNTGVWVGASAD